MSLVGLDILNLIVVLLAIYRLVFQVSNGVKGHLVGDVFELSLRPSQLHVAFFPLRNILRDNTRAVGLVGDVDKFLISSGVLSFIEWILIVSKRNVRRSFMLFGGFKSGHCPALRSAYDP